MKYSEALPKFKSGDLIAVSHQPWQTIDDVESHIVRIITESEYSHAAVIMVSGSGEPFVMEAIVPCVTLSSLTKYLDYGFYWIPTPDKPMTEEEQVYAFTKQGESYSKLEAIAGQLNWLDIAQDQKWQCSELTIAMRRLSGLELGPKATPAAVVKNALSQGYTLHYITKD